MSLATQFSIDHFVSTKPSETRPMQKLVTATDRDVFNTLVNSYLEQGYTVVPGTLVNSLTDSVNQGVRERWAIVVQKP